MNKVYVVTYATHREGLFDDLINNKFNVEIKVLGFNKKWRGFTDKIKGVYEFIQNKNDNDILIFLDGFDSIVNKPLEMAIKRFQKLNCKVLFSKEQIHNEQSNFLIEYFFKYTIRKVFGTCKDNLTANSGLYMGYIGYLKPILYNILNFRNKELCKSDQRKLNMLCPKFDYIKIDTENLIFYNCPNYMDCKNVSSCFIQYPGQMTLKRGKRAMYEYTSLFVSELFVLFLLIFYFLKNKKKFLK